jgi:hypothetical protein
MAELAKPSKHANAATRNILFMGRLLFGGELFASCGVTRRRWGGSSHVEGRIEPVVQCKHSLRLQKCKLPLLIFFSDRVANCTNSVRIRWRELALQFRMEWEKNRGVLACAGCQTTAVVSVMAIALTR